MANGAFAAAASASLAFVLAGCPLNAEATSKTAGQISLNSIPPTSVKVDVKDLPVIGSLVSGTYTRVDDKDVTSPSISIKSPKDKIGAIKAVRRSGISITTSVSLGVAAGDAIGESVFISDVTSTSSSNATEPAPAFSNSWTRPPPA